jgi:threonine aldolase
MKRFDSDYLEGCLPEILQRLGETNLEQSVGYGEDAHCTAAREKIRAAVGRPDADVHFLVGGTQTNVTVISSLLKPYQGVVCAESGHINVHETGAVEHSGHKVMALPATAGKITAAQVEEAFASHRDDANHEHMVQPGMVYISFPTEMGTLYSKDELTAISAVCRRWQRPLFVDGARLGYGLASPLCDLTLPELAALVDVFYIGGTKQGALFGEAVVFCNPALAHEFRYHIKQNGGMLAKGRLLGIQFETLFTDGLYLKSARHAIDEAFRLRDGLRAKGYRFLCDSPTNQQFPILEDVQIEALRAEFGFEFWQRIDATHSAVRFCTSWATRPEAVDALLAAL